MTVTKKKNVNWNFKKAFLWMQKSLWIQAFLAIPIIISIFGTLINENFPLNNLYFKFIVSSLFVFYFGLRFWKAYADLWNKKIGMNLLIALASHSVYLYSIVIWIIKAPTNESLRVFFDVPVVLIFIVQIGWEIEGRITKEVETNLESLFIENIKNVTLLKKASSKQISIYDVQENDHLLIKRGQIIPVDSYLLSPEAWVDTTNINGESLPKSFLAKSFLKSGMINLERAIQIKVAKSFANSTVFYLLKQLEKTLKQETRLKRISAKISKYFVPFIVLVSLLTFIIWTSLYETNTISLDSYLYRNFVTSGIEAGLLNAATVLSIACPCAFGLAAPIIHSITAGLANKKGIIYYQLNRFEENKQLDYLFLDKTGTLSKNELTIKKMTGSKEALQLLISMEQNSFHPFARSLLKTYQGDLLALGNVQEEIAFGLIYQDKNETYYLSNPQKLAKRLHLEVSEDLLKSHEHVIALATKNGILASVTFADELKEDILDALKLFKRSAKQVIIISGDNQERVDEIVKKFHLDDGYGNLSANDKLKMIQKYQAQGTVAFLGDGLNDALAIQAADLGLAFDHGSDITNQVAAASLKSNDLLSAAKALMIPNKTKKAIYLNYFWAFSFNLAVLPLAFLGILPIYLGAIVMSASTCILLLHSLFYKLRLKSFLNKKN